MKDQSRWLRGFELRRMLPTADPRRVHVALAEPILRIGAARQARLWLKRNFLKRSHRHASTCPMHAMVRPRALAAASEGAVTERTLVRLVSPWVDLRQRPSLTMLFRTEATPTASGLERYRASASAVTTEPRGRLSGLAILAISAWTGGRSIEIIRATVASSEQRCFVGCRRLMCWNSA